MPLLVPTDETVQIWTLVGSNFAALLPSYWAMQHQGYSEWMAFTASGAASGFYHSCDAGGWCALKYDTLQVDKLLYINNAHRNFRCNITIMLELDFAWVFASLTRDSNLNNLLGLATQFLDFWLAFLVVIVTCVEVASLKQNVKAVAHVGFAIVTAAITKEDATR